MSENQQANKFALSGDAMQAAEQEGQGTLKEHFQELRKRLLYCFIVVAVAFFIIATCFAESLVQLISVPVKAKGIEFIYVGLAEALTAQLQVSFIAAMMVSSPFIFYQIWGFIEPALYDNEKKALLVFMGCSVLLFLTGHHVLCLYRRRYCDSHAVHQSVRRVYVYFCAVLWYGI